MIDASQLPRVPSEVLQQDQQQAVQYARAPAGSHQAPLRPAATQGTVR
jgi:hypothetical protein